jgi:hypothetical protein
MFIRFLKGTALALVTLLTLALTAAAALGAVVLVSAGLLVTVVSLGCITGLLGAVASDISPPAMLFTGLFCVFTALSVASALYILCPKAARRFNFALGKYFS